MYVCIYIYTHKFVQVLHMLNAYLFAWTRKHGYIYIYIYTTFEETSYIPAHVHEYLSVCGSWSAFRIPSLLPLHGLHGENKTWRPPHLQRPVAASTSTSSEVTRPCCRFSCCEPVALQHLAQNRANSAVAKRPIAKSLFVRKSMPHTTPRLFWEHQVRTCNVQNKPLRKTSTGSKVTTTLLNHLRTCWLPHIAKVPHCTMGLL